MRSAVSWEDAGTQMPWALREYRWLCRSFAAWALAFALPLRPAAADVTVSVSPAGVDIDARSAPLSEILDQLARKQDFKVVYDGPPPRAPITATLRGAGTAEAVLKLIEGLGLSYAIGFDADGRRVQMLLLYAGVSGSKPSLLPPAPHPGPFPELPHPDPSQSIVVDPDAEPQPPDEGEPPEGAAPPPFPQIDPPEIRLPAPGSTPPEDAAPGAAPPVATPRDMQGVLPPGMSAGPGPASGDGGPIPGSPPIAVPRLDGSGLPPGMRPSPQPTPQPN